MLDLAASTRIVTKDGITTVTIGGQMADWQKWELIKEFRREFSSSNIEVRGVGVNLKGESSIKTSF